MQHHRPHVRRTAIALLLAIAATCMASFAPVGAQEQPSVIKGGANAQADAGGVIINAGVSLGWTLGRSLANYRDVTGTSQGNAFDISALEALLTLPRCDGKFAPFLNVDTIPPKTVADSFSPGSEQGFTAEVFFPGLDGAPRGERVGTQSAKATRQPWAEGSADVGNLDFSVFQVLGAKTSAVTEYNAGVRSAKAVTTADRVVVLGGLAQFEKPRWEATATSGGASSSKATFTFEWAQVLGNYVTGADVNTNMAFLKAMVEGLLGFLGVQLIMPEVGPAPADAGISISPMALRITGGDLARYLLVPLLGSEFMKQVRTQNIAEDCRNKELWTVLDAVERALGGAGHVEISVGGASVSTTDADFSVPAVPEESFAETPTDTTPFADTPIEETPFADTPVEELPLDDFGAEVDDFGDDLALEDSFGEEAFAALAEEPLGDEADDGEATEADEIAAPKPSPRGSDAAAVAVGVLALLGAVALSMGDRVVGLRARRRIP